MGKLVQPLKIAIDLQSLVDKKIPHDLDELYYFKPWKGSLGAITVLSEIFDLYLLTSFDQLSENEILRWLELAQINTSFRKILKADESIRDMMVTSGISVTILSTEALADKLKDVTRIYFLEKKHYGDIQDGILYVSQWREIIKDISFFSTNNYGF